MEKKQKTYQSTRFIQLDTYVLVNGQRVLVEFRGGSIEPIRRNGIFSTSNADLIKQMDADIERIGADRASYKCIHEEVLIDDLPEKDNIVLPERSVTDIKTVTAARGWLLDASEAGTITKGITSGMIKNRTDVLRIAGENNVKFPDLPTE
jgi:hypothetical protein